MGYVIKGRNIYGEIFALDAATSLSDAIEIASAFKMHKAKEIENIAVLNESTGVIMWDSGDSPVLKRYTELDHEKYQTLSKMDNPKSTSPSVYFDLDGTLAKWYPDGRGLTLNEMIDPANHYFRDLEPIVTMLHLARRLQESGMDVCVISAAYKDTIRDKWQWIKENLGFLPEENIFFCPIGADKNNFVKGNAQISILIDDYNKNLNEWNGIAVKALNGINSHQSVFEEIDLTIAERVLHESIDSKHNLTCLNLVAELIETEKNKITELIPDKNLKKTYGRTKE